MVEEPRFHLCPWPIPFHQIKDIMPAIISCLYCTVNFPFSTGPFPSAQKHVIIYPISKKKKSLCFLSPFNYYCIILLFFFNPQSSFYIHCNFSHFFFNPLSRTFTVTTPLEQFQLGPPKASMLTTLMVISWFSWYSGYHEHLTQLSTLYFWVFTWLPGYHSLFAPLLTHWLLLLHLLDWSLYNSLTGVIQGSVLRPLSFHIPIHSLDDLSQFQTLNTINRPLTAQFIPQPYTHTCYRQQFLKWMN